MEMNLMINEILFLAIYCTIITKLSSLIFYKLRFCFYPKPCLRLSKKMRQQTILGLFFLHICIIAITIGIMPWFEYNEAIVECISMSLSLALAFMYTIFYLTNHNLCGGIDFTVILVLTAFLTIPLQYLNLSLKLYYKAWLKVSGDTFIIFMIVSYFTSSVLGFIYRVFPGNREEILKMLDLSETNNK